VQPHRASNHVNKSNFTNTTPPPSEGLVNLNRDAELAYDTGRELGSPALTHQMSPTTLRVLQLHGPIIMTHHNKRRRTYIYSDVSLCLFVADCTVLTRHWKVETPRKRWRTSPEESPRPSRSGRKPPKTCSKSWGRPLKETHSWAAPSVPRSGTRHNDWMYVCMLMYIQNMRI